MLRSIILATAVMALGAPAATAAPLTGSLTVSESGEAAKDARKGGVVEFIINQMKVSVTTIRGQAGHSDDSASKYRSSDDGECEAAKKPAKEDAEQSADKDKKPAGPEPIYFGF